MIIARTPRQGSSVFLSLKTDTISPNENTGVKIENAIRFPEWVTSTSYSVGDYIIHNNTLYKCISAHTSGTFETDRTTNSYWVTVCPFAINTVIAQYPTASSNTINTAFPVAERPAALYGGTWTQIYNTDAVFFRTEGDFHESDAQNTNRTDGKQTHQAQSHAHYSYTRSGGSGYNTGDGYAYGTLSIETSNEITYGPYGTPLIGYENRPQNRIFLLWKRTA